MSNHWKHDEPDQPEVPDQSKEPDTHRALKCDSESPRCFGEVKTHVCENYDGGFTSDFCEYHLEVHLKDC